MLRCSLGYITTCFRLSQVLTGLKTGERHIIKSGTVVCFDEWTDCGTANMTPKSQPPVRQLFSSGHQTLSRSVSHPRAFEKLEYKSFSGEDNNEIRVLGFLDVCSSIESDDTIQCSIKNVSLGDTTTYLRSVWKDLELGLLAVIGTRLEIAIWPPIHTLFEVSAGKRQPFCLWSIF